MQLRLLCAVFLSAAALPAADWGPVQFLVGNWKGVGGGAPGQRTGEFSFTPDVQGKVLVRRSFAEFAAARHDDLIIVYREKGQLRAIFFDSEDHVIHYAVRSIEGGVQFVSDDPGPRFRLTYRSTGKDVVKIKFEVAPPGKEFSTYIDASARREP